MTKEQAKYRTARALLDRSREQMRLLSEDAARKALLNAANAYAFWGESDKAGDFDNMMTFTDNLEKAALHFAEYFA